MIAEWIDRVASVYATGDFAHEVARARKEFRERSGRTLEAPEGGDADLDAALLAFLEWYVLDRALPDGGRPIERFLRERAGGLGEDDLASLRGLAASHRSLFSVERLAGDGTDGERPWSVHLRDLVLGGAWLVRERRRMAGVGEGDVLDARLVPRDGTVSFSPTVLFHPAEARAAIPPLVDRLRARGLSRLAIVEDLARRRLRCDRFRNVSPLRIYSEDA